MEASRCRGNGTATLIAVQSGDSPCPVRVSIGMPLCQRWLLGWGLAHEVVVAVRSVITSRGSEGPLGCRGLGLHRDLGDCLEGLVTPRSKVELCRLRLGTQQTVTGKTAYEMRNLKPDWGNLTIRDFRGDGGNLAEKKTAEGASILLDRPLIVPVVHEFFVSWID